MSTNLKPEVGSKWVLVSWVYDTKRLGQICTVTAPKPGSFDDDKDVWTDMHGKEDYRRSYLPLNVYYEHFHPLKDFLKVGSKWQVNGQCWRIHSVTNNHFTLCCGAEYQPERLNDLIANYTPVVEEVCSGIVSQVSSQVGSSESSQLPSVPTYQNGSNNWHHFSIPFDGRETPIPKTRLERVKLGLESDPYQFRHGQSDHASFYMEPGFDPFYASRITYIKGVPDKTLTIFGPDMSEP